LEEGTAFDMLSVPTWRTARVGLSHQPAAEDEARPYSSRPYRFIVDEGYLSKLPYKENICKQQFLATPQAMDAATIRHVLGYKPAWL
jgi:hypothetical protein